MFEVLRTILMVVAGLGCLFLSGQFTAVSKALRQSEEKLAALETTAKTCDQQVVQCQAYQARIVLELRYMNRFLEECNDFGVKK